ncbi:hypothetical protein DFP74_0277 [Nocardiopsis sp. Huas11]|uniref:hypothetical protein n=1 Tax=Nocardiopsis sp. Huas11 TaxID=2183912 RepID=UPI000EB4621A|nr:hypothetical protein [Nocardiopsis sp. Huas11]RKS04707.1 hypothetical protein DFP74_0277 [Nocardiopsis sp. Huas11]
MSEVVIYAVGGLLVLVAAVMSGGLLLGAWRPRGAGRLQDRWDALHRFVNALFMTVVALLSVSWTMFPQGLWYLLVVLLAAAAAGTVLRWPELAWRAEDEKAATRRVSALGTLPFAAVAVAVLVVVLV